MVSTLSSRSSGPGSSLGQGHCVVFLGKTWSRETGISSSLMGHLAGIQSFTYVT